MAHGNNAGIILPQKQPDRITVFEYLSESQAPFFHGRKAAAANNEMVQHFDIYQLPSLDEGARHRHIIRAGSRVAAGMVVNNNDGCGIASNGGLEYLANANL